MNWISNVVRPKIRSILNRRETPENLWIKCPDTGQLGLLARTSKPTELRHPHLELSPAHERGRAPEVDLRQ